MRARTFAWIGVAVVIVAGNTGLVIRLGGRPRGPAPSRPRAPFAPLNETRAATRAQDAEDAQFLAGWNAPSGDLRPRLRVLVVDAAGAPVAGASVRAEGARRAIASPIHEPPYGRGTTGADGSCDLTLARLARTRVIAEKEGYARGEATVGAESPVRVVLERAALLRGRVVDAKSEGALAGAVVLAVPDGDLASMLETRAAEDGTFSFPGLAAGRWLVTARGEDHPAAGGSLDLVPGSEGSLEIRLTKGFTLRGRVVFPGTTLQATEGSVSAPVDPDLHDVQVRTAAIGPDGRFVLRGLRGPERRFRVTTGGVVYLAGGHLARIDPATREQVGEIEVPLPSNNPSGLEHQGVVRDGEGRPVAGARVLVGTHVLQQVHSRQVHNNDRGLDVGLAGQDVTDADGRYVIRAERGGGEILVLHPDYAPTHFVLPPRSRDRKFDLVLQRGVPLVVEVRDSRGLPAAGVEVYTMLIHSDPRTAYSQYGDVEESVRAHPVTDAHGRAVFPHVWLGTRYVAARSADGLEGVRAVLDLDPAKLQRTVTLDMKRLPSVSGRVVDAAGKPVAGAPVAAGGLEFGGERLRTQTGADGRFSFPAVFANPAWEQLGWVPLDVGGFRPVGGEGTASVPLGGSADVVVERR